MPKGNPAGYLPNVKAAKGKGKKGKGAPAPAPEKGKNPFAKAVKAAKK